MNEFVEIAVRIAGGQRELARTLGVSNTAVYKWVKNARVPQSRCVAVSTAARGMISPRQLNPEFKA